MVSNSQKSGGAFGHAVVIGSSIAGLTAARILTDYFSKVTIIDRDYAFPTFYGGIGEAVGAYGRGLATVIDPTYQGFKVLDGVGAAEGVPRIKSH